MDAKHHAVQVVDRLNGRFLHAGPSVGGQQHAMSRGVLVHTTDNRCVQSTELYAVWQSTRGGSLKRNQSEPRTRQCKSPQPFLSASFANRDIPFVFRGNAFFGWLAKDGFVISPHAAADALRCWYAGDSSTDFTKPCDPSNHSCVPGCTGEFAEAVERVPWGPIQGGHLDLRLLVQHQSERSRERDQLCSSTNTNTSAEFRFLCCSEACCSYAACPWYNELILDVPTLGRHWPSAIEAIVFFPGLDTWREDQVRDRRSRLRDQIRAWSATAAVPPLVSLDITSRTTPFTLVEWG